MRRFDQVSKRRASLVIIGFITFIVTLIFTINSRILFDISYPIYRNSCYKNLKEILHARALNNQITVTIMNDAYIDLTIHWIHRLNRLDVHNFFVYIQDQQSAEYFQRHHLAYLCYMNPQGNLENQSSYTLWGSSSFKKIGMNKMFLANQILNLKYSVLVSEIDVVWFENPQKELEQYSREFDVISQGIRNTSPDNRRNIGFFYLPYRNSTLRIMNKVEEILVHNPSRWDQGVFNEVVDYAVQKKEAKDLFLNLKKYAFENFYLDPTIPINGSSVAHLVGLDSAIDKTFVIKERTYSEDVFGYLSYPRKYVTYKNSFIEPDRQIELLKKALYLSKILNRTLILPRFHCDHIRFHNGFYNMNLPSNCTAERLINIQQLISNFQIRENSFLTNPLVPIDILNSRHSYNMTCNSDELENDTATILDLGDLSCFPTPIQNITLHTCPPSQLYKTVLGYGPVCK